MTLAGGGDLKKRGRETGSRKKATGRKILKPRLQQINKAGNREAKGRKAIDVDQ